MCAAACYSDSEQKQSAGLSKSNNRWLGQLTYLNARLVHEDKRHILSHEIQNVSGCFLALIRQFFFGKNGSGLCSGTEISNFVAFVDVGESMW